MQITTKSVAGNLFWRFAERCGAQGVSLIVSIVLARLIAPEAYGTIAIVTVFTTILNVFVDSGMANALIQKKDPDDLDFSTVFFFNIFVCLALYALMFLAAPFIAAFYEDATLVPVLRVLCLIVVVSGVRNVQQAYVSKQMIFKKFFYATICGTIGSAVIGIFMAYKGFGIWALVGQQLSNSVLGTVLLWITVKWRPKFMFSFSRLKGLFSYGWKLLVSSLIDTLYNDIRQLIIGKMYSSNDLAYYNRGQQFPQIIVNNINASIDSVLLPTMSAAQDNQEAVKRMTRKAIKTSTYLIMPLMVGLAVCAEPLTALLLTEKWLPSVPFMRIFCITYSFYPIHTANLNAIKAMGRSDLYLKMEIIKKVVGIALLFSSMWFGVMAMAYTALFSNFISQIINTWPNKKLLNYSYLEQLKDIFENMILSVIMGAVVFSISFLNLSNIVTLLIQVAVGLLIYVLGSKLLRLESFEYVLGVLKSFLKKKTS